MRKKMFLLWFSILLYSTLSAAEDIHWERVITVQQVEPKSGNVYNPTPMRININTANKEELEKLVGIGPKKAEAIITFRETHGRFKSWEDLRKIKGLSKKRLDGILQKNSEKMVLE